MARATKNIETPTEQDNTFDPDKLPGTTFSAVLGPVVSEAVEGYRWSKRLNRADVMKEAMSEWADKRGLLDDARARLIATHADELAEAEQGDSDE